MNNIEKQLAEEKKRIDSITAPDELENRLKTALGELPIKKRKRIHPIWKMVAALFFVVMIGYQYNALAFYGKKLIGFDEVMTGTLQELNEEGMGQIVEQTTLLDDGTHFTIDGIMTDANQLVLYYSLTNPNGLDYFDHDPLFGARITGFLTDSFVGGGTAQKSDDQTEIKGTMSFDPVSPFAKKLTLHFSQNPTNGHTKIGTLTFPYNPNKAMQTEIKQGIKKTLKVDKGTITFETITATPMMTKIEGRMNVENFDRVPLALDGIELIANGTPVHIIGSGSRTSIFGRTFEISYDRLPKPLQSLELVMKEFVGYENLNERIPLASVGAEQPYSLHEKELWVKNISMTNQGVELTIATAEDVMLDGVSIIIQDESIPLSTTINQYSIEHKNGQILKERTLLFEVMGEPEYLIIEGMHYMKLYNQTMEIPVK